MREYTAVWFSKIDLDPPDIDEMIDTKGPANRFNNALFIEKEGFSEILADARFPERYSMALMSTKGIPVAAACDLIDALVSENHYRSYVGQRVEINAMTSEQLIEWLDHKFAEHNVTKLIPDAETIAEAYKRAMFLNRIQAKIEEFAEEMEGDDTDVPAGLRDQVAAMLANDPIASWDRVVWDIAS
ncbi:MAG: hypothetical protein V1800_03865 [Candidatus Latescibacterota bacterium]